MTTALAWRAEQACLDAWPALRSAHHGDWLLRFGEGVSRRANSVNPLHDRAETIADDLADFARIYRHHGLPLIVRVPTLLAGAAQIDRELDANGFGREGETCTLFRAFGDERFDADPDVTITLSADADWLAAIGRLQAQSPSHAAVYARVVDAIALPAGFAALRRDGRIVATAYGALSGELLAIESVVVDPALRGQGLARRMMRTLFGWARGHGANAVCLQVVADNTAGRALYASLGFDTELYRYHYRRASAS
ncbi:GCN5-related N-acetyltransferase [Rhodopseudomonas palustris HaA2]|uniref:GCN5-related N-acetyltransferase n=1 Tax=Rhodopseudomonas palustris (strain HaA2) TaxID=316058 RepID=Q2ITN0_RHOP2|nr:GNAT family N-acetyltransferase [Rhodopseudomonas palustris]ABD08430.1 GCN5-related N-acetyltransferase [Rhodopseudomonas palustris HaA2]